MWSFFALIRILAKKAFRFPKFPSQNRRIGQGGAHFVPFDVQTAVETWQASGESSIPSSPQKAAWRLTRCGNSVGLPDPRRIRRIDLHLRAAGRKRMERRQGDFGSNV